MTKNLVIFHQNVWVLTMAVKLLVRRGSASSSQISLSVREPVWKHSLSNIALMHPLLTGTRTHIEINIEKYFL